MQSGRNIDFFAAKQRPGFLPCSRSSWARHKSAGNWKQRCESGPLLAWTDRIDFRRPILQCTALMRLANPVVPHNILFTDNDKRNSCNVCLRDMGRPPKVETLPPPKQHMPSSETLLRRQ